VFAAKVDIDIYGPGGKQIPIAVPNLDVTPQNSQYADVGTKISDVLSNDLTFHGFLSVLDKTQYGGIQDTLWNKFRLDYLVKGSVYASGNTMVVELKLLEMPGEILIEGRRYTANTNEYRKIAHRFCDVIIKAITGEHGVSLSKIAFVAPNGKNRDFFTADFDGFGTEPESNDKSIVISPRYSPNGKYMAYTSYRYGKPYLFIKDLHKKVFKKIGAHPGLNVSPAWHPDGNTLAASLSKDGNPDLFLINSEGHIISKLTSGPGANISPTFSPDGNKIAFVSDRTGSPQIYLMDLNTRSIKRITYSGDYNTDPQWSPKGDKIAYVSRSGGFQIYTISPDGSSATKLTEQGNNENPSWSPDGRQLLFTSTRLGGKNLFAMLANGGFQRPIIKNIGKISTPFWGPNFLE
jgi:TolB protein